jgi:hypothetical protein
MKKTTNYKILHFFERINLVLFLRHLKNNAPSGAENERKVVNLQKN